jgi:acyl-lipid omega-6 desaturase (Delta-12 desaturase)
MRARDWLPIVERYAAPVPARSARQLASTLALFAGLYAAMFALAANHYPLVLVLAAPTACVMVRGFSIQHDCQHGAYFASRTVQTWVGRALCLITLVPHGHHRRLHAVHHAVTGRLDRRRAQPGWFPRTAADFDLITVAEFRALPPRARRLYRFLRQPLVIFTVVPLYLFLFSYRVPVLHPVSRGRGWISTQLTSLAIVGALALGVALAGARPFFAVFAPTMICYVTIGVWLFYVQHQFERTYWRADRDWDHREAALRGSSYLALPRPLQWLTGNIGIHHVHHLCPAIPNYRLADCLRDHPALARISRVGVAEGLRMLQLALWDEERGRLVGFTR